MALAAIATAAALPALAGESSITVSANVWSGAASSDWFDRENWLFGQVFPLPYSVFETYIGPTGNTVNGIPTEIYSLPQQEAVIGASFSTPSFTMAAWDGISQIRLVQGGLLTTTATIGADVHPNQNYTPSGPIQNATVILDGGQIAGSWTFLERSTLIVRAANSQLAGSVVSGTIGNLQIASGGSLATSGNLSLQQVSNQGTIEVGPGSSLSLAGEIAGGGTLSLNGTDTGWASVYLTGPTTFAGPGQTILGDSPYNVIHSANSGATLTIGAGHTLRGGGNLGTANYAYLNGGLVNQGSIVVDASSGMTINTGGTGVRNEGSVLVGSRLSISAPVDNTGGSFELQDHARLVLQGSLQGGTLKGGTGAQLAGGGAFSNLSLQGSFDIAAGDGIALSGTITNTGSLNLKGDATGWTTLYLSGATTFAGPGQTVLGDSPYNVIHSANNTATLTIGAGHTLRGGGNLGTSSYGYLNGGLINQGTILVDAAGGMSVDTGGGAAFTNQGLVEIADGSFLRLNGVSASGGVFKGSGSAALVGGSYSDVALQGQLQVTAGNSLNLSGQIANSGTLKLNGNSNAWTTLYLTGATTFAGPGQTILGDSPYNVIHSANSGATLTIGAGHTLRGGGNLGTANYAYLNGGLVNQGSIVVDASSGMTINTGGTGVRNEGSVLVGSRLSISAPVDNTGGSFELQDHARLVLQGSLQGGTLKGGTGAQLAGGGAFSNLSLQGSFDIAAGDGIALSGTITNTGSLNLKGDATGWATLYLNGATTFAGPGQTVLGDSSYNVIHSANGGATLTIGAGHTLRGGGNLGSSSYGYLNGGLINQGSIVVDAASGMRIDTGGGAPVLNRGTLVVAAGSALDASAQNITQDTAAALTQVQGTLKVAELDLQAGTLKGTGTIVGDVVNSGGVIAPGNSPGKLSIDGDLVLGDASELLIEVLGLQQGISYDWLDVSGTVALDGDLHLVIGPDIRIGDSFSFLTSGAGISGAFDRVWADGYGLDIRYGDGVILATVTSISAVPEASSLAMLLAGAGLVALATRRRVAA